jgi:hypothetical protein
MAGTISNLSKFPKTFRIPIAESFNVRSRVSFDRKVAAPQPVVFPFKLRGKTDRETDKEVIRAVKQKLVPTAILIV